MIEYLFYQDLKQASGKIQYYSTICMWFHTFYGSDLEPDARGF